MVIRSLESTDLPAVLSAWAAQRTRGKTSSAGPAWSRPVAERRGDAEARLRSALAGSGDRAQAFVALRGGAAVAYLIGREVWLPRGSTYLTYVPEHFLNVGADDWGATSVADLPLLADLYAKLAGWGVARGVDTHLIAIEPGDEGAELWADLGFARHDAYAYLPLGEVRAAGDAATVRAATSADLAVATDLIIAEARHHQAAPIFAYAPPGLDDAKRRDLAESLDDDAAFVLVAEVDGVVAGAISAYSLAELPFWAATALPTPCLYIDSAYVRPEARGRGMLRALVAGLAAAAPVGTAGLFVTYLPANFGAARAWTGLGFRPFALIQQRRLDPRAVRQRREQSGR